MSIVSNRTRSYLAQDQSTSAPEDRPVPICHVSKINVDHAIVRLLLSFFDDEEDEDEVEVEGAAGAGAGAPSLAHTEVGGKLETSAS